MDGVVYYDTRYPSTWMQGGPYLRDFLTARGFQVKNADVVKTWMQDYIAKRDGHGAVCVMAHDVVPDTVAEDIEPSATIRKFLDTGGRVIWLGDYPFYAQGHADGTRTSWYGDGMTRILGFRSQLNDDIVSCALTDSGQRWGLDVAWQSKRAVQTGWEPHLVLARSAGGYPAGWAHFYHPEGKGGFVRIHDASLNYQNNDALCQDVYDLAVQRRTRLAVTEAIA